MGNTREEIRKEYENHCREMRLPQITLYAIKVNAKLYSIHGENREPGYLAIDRDACGSYYATAHPLHCALQSEGSAKKIIEAEKDRFLSSGYELIELKF